VLGESLAELLLDVRRDLLVRPAEELEVAVDGEDAADDELDDQQTETDHARFSS
jgi:hypothetical protein